MKNPQKRRKNWCVSPENWCVSPVPPGHRPGRHPPAVEAARDPSTPIPKCQRSLAPARSHGPCREVLTDEPQQDQTYAPQARRDFIRSVTDRAALYGLTKGQTEPVVEKGDVAMIGGRPYPRSVAALRKRLKGGGKGERGVRIVILMALRYKVMKNPREDGGCLG